MTSRLHYHSEWLLVGWAMVAIIIFFSLTPKPPVPGFTNADKLFHMAAYGGLMLWFAQLYERPLSRNAYAVGFILMGAGLEVLQQMGTVRVFDWADMLANTIGVVVIWLLWRYKPIRVLSWFEQSIGKRK